MAATRFARNCQAGFHCSVRLKPLRPCAPQHVKEVVDLQIAPDAAFVQHLHGMLQFVADGLDQLATGRLTKIDEDAKETIMPCNGDRQEQAGPHSAVSAVPFFDKHQTVGPIDGVDETAERRRTFDASSDRFDYARTGGAEAWKSRRVLGGHDVDSGDARDTHQGGANLRRRKAVTRSRAVVMTFASPDRLESVLATNTFEG